MSKNKLEAVLQAELEAMAAAGRRKGAVPAMAGVVPAAGRRGPRYLVAGAGERPFLRMNANGYLGLAGHPALAAAAEAAVRRFGVGPGAVRFISGTWTPHLELEARLAAFHGRPAALLFSSAYAAVLGCLAPLLTAETAVVSDALNHNCIINAIRLARPADKRVYGHLDLGELERHLGELAGTCRRVVVVTDGVFSMRGDYAPLDRIMALARAHSIAFADGVVVVVDDSHGVGALGDSGRGTEEQCGAPPADLLIATLGKALGVNGGYAVAAAPVIDWLRETAPTYVYSNPIGAAEAAAALAALDILDSADGRRRLDHVRALTRRFEEGLQRHGLETIPGPHPVVPLMVRDTARTTALVRHLYDHGILASGLGYPVVPRGDEEIRFQISAEHTEADIDEALAVLAGFEG